jgi:hypothetical protein
MFGKHMDDTGFAPRRRSAIVVGEAPAALDLLVGRRLEGERASLDVTARRYVVMMTPVLDVLESTSSIPAGTAPCPKSRLPGPTTTGKIQPSPRPSSSPTIHPG